MSTRRRDGRQFDHGAQYFTTKSDAFESVVQQWAASGVVASWSERLGEWTQGAVVELEAEQRWVGTPRMSALTRHLSADVEVVAACRIVAMSRTDNQWILDAEDGSRHGPFDAVVLTCPGPQAAALAPKHSEVFQRATTLAYSPCWAAMITVSAPSDGLLAGYKCAHPVAAWIANDASKPGRPVPGRWVVHAQAAWSAENEEAPAVDVEHALSAAFTEVVGVPADTVQVHRWRYALAMPTSGPSMVFEPELGLGLCGDALVGGTVESAWQSAVDLVQYMTDMKG